MQQQQEEGEEEDGGWRRRKRKRRRMEEELECSQIRILCLPGLGNETFSRHLDTRPPKG